MKTGKFVQSLTGFPLRTLNHLHTDKRFHMRPSIDVSQYLGYEVIYVGMLGRWGDSQGMWVSRALAFRFGKKRELDTCGTPSWSEQAKCLIFDLYNMHTGKKIEKLQMSYENVRMSPIA